jgi:hypothetical protein
MPSPLVLAGPSGPYGRFLVPLDVRPLVGSRFIVRPLGVPYGDAARLVAARMAVALSQVFDKLRRGQCVDLEKALEAARAKGRKDLVVEEVVLPNRVRVGRAQIDTPQDAEMYQRLLERLAEKDPLAAAVAGYVPAAPEPAPIGPLLSECIAKHLERLEAARLDRRTIMDSRHTLRLLLGFVGDIPAQALDADRVQAFMEAVEHWPRHATKRRAYRDLSVLEVIELAKANGEPPPKGATLTKHWDRLAVFVGHLQSSSVLRHDPMAGLTPPDERHSEMEPDTGRPFTHAELQAVFGPAFLPWASKYPHRFWGPLLGLYSGARVTEVAQLRAADVMNVDGVPGFLVTTKAKGNKVKNPNSLRFVPLAQPLLDAGFLAYVEEVRAAGVERLFPDLPNSTGLGLGRQLSRQFSTYIKRQGVEEEGMGFHAFRHYFITHLDRALAATGMEMGDRDVAIGRITGHDKPPQSVLRKVYVDREGLAVPAAVQPETLPKRVETLALFTAPVTVPEHVPGQFAENLKRAVVLVKREARAKKSKTPA